MLSAGNRLGPYEIVSPLGAGGWARYTSRVIRVWVAQLQSRSCPSWLRRIRIRSAAERGVEPDRKSVV